MANFFKKAFRNPISYLAPGVAIAVQAFDDLGKSGKGATGQWNDHVKDERAKAYNDALNDNTLDQKTMQEISDLYTGANGTKKGSAADIAAMLNKAKEGTGIYGIRKLTQNTQAIMNLAPGRSQLTTLGSDSVLGV